MLDPTHGADYTIWIVAALLYVSDAAKLLPPRQLLLVEAGRGRFAAAFSATPYTIAGRVLSFAPLLLPYRGVFVASWGSAWTDGARLRKALESIERLRSSLGGARVLGILGFVLLFAVGPALTLWLGTTAAIIYTAAALYPTVLVAIAYLWLRRRRARRRVVPVHPASGGPRRERPGHAARAFRARGLRAPGVQHDRALLVQRDGAHRSRRGQVPADLRGRRPRRRPRGVRPSQGRPDVSLPRSKRQRLRDHDGRDRARSHDVDRGVPGSGPDPGPVLHAVLHGHRALPDRAEEPGWHQPRGPSRWRARGSRVDRSPGAARSPAADPLVRAVVVVVNGAAASSRSAESDARSKPGALG